MIFINKLPSQQTRLFKLKDRTRNFHKRRHHSRLRTPHTLQKRAQSSSSFEKMKPAVRVPTTPSLAPSIQFIQILLATLCCLITFLHQILPVRYFLRRILNATE